MRVDFRRPQIFVAKDILQHTDIDMTLLVHQCGRRMPQFMDGISGAAQIDLSQIFLYNILHRLRADSLSLTADKNGVFIDQAVFGPHFQVGLISVDAGIVQVNDPLFVSFSRNFHCRWKDQYPPD